MKLAFALEAFGVDPAGATAVDVGANIGGFTDCLLQQGTARVFTVDTAYGTLAWKLRNDPRVEVCERNNALHWRPPAPVDLVAIDAGWTPQAKILPAAAEMLVPGGCALSLVKPQYEAPREWLEGGVLLQERLDDVLERVSAACPQALRIVDRRRSPYEGSGGNVEFWLHLRGST